MMKTDYRTIISNSFRKYELAKIYPPIIKMDKIGIRSIVSFKRQAIHTI